MKDLKTYRTLFERKQGRREQIKKDLQRFKLSLRNDIQELKKHEKAREIIREVGLKTQQELQFYISDITTLAMQAVFPDDPYSLKVDFVQRRNKTECDLYFERDGELVDPLSASGGGAVDVAAFALRLTSWTMQKPKSRNTIILDEPMRFLSEDRQEQASLMVKELSDKLGLQFIIVTHEEKLTNDADRIFKVSKKNNITKVVSDAV